MTDLVTRLRALAERAADGTEYSPDGYWIPDLRDMSDALREAADALEQAQARHTTLTGVAAGYAEEPDLLRHRYNQWAEKCAKQEEREIEICADLMRERDALRAKLGDLRFLYDGAQIDIKRLEAKLAEAEAEAAALREALEWYADADNHDGLAQLGGGSMALLDGGKKAREALSQRGPGAALLERVMKVVAVAEATRHWIKVAEREPTSVDEAYQWGNACMDAAKEAKEALAALEAKP